MFFAESLLHGSLRLAQALRPELGKDITPLDLTASRVSQNVVRILIGAAGRWVVPKSIFLPGSWATGELKTMGTASCEEASYQCLCLWLHSCW